MDPNFMDGSAHGLILWAVDLIKFQFSESLGSYFSLLGLSGVTRTFIGPC